MSEKPTTDKPKTGAESPTTARPLDFDDDNETPVPTESRTSSSPNSKSPKPGVRFSEEATEIPPAKPPRPVNKMEQDAKALKDMFPDVDAKVIKAVLVAGGGDVERATNALLSMSDPDFREEEIAPPARPPRPVTGPRDHSYEDDFMLAQRLQREEQQRAHSTQYARTGSRGRGDHPMSGGRRETSEERYEREHSFFDDDLPVIKKNIEQGFKDTQKNVSKWVDNFIKKFDGEPEEYDRYGNPVPPPRHHNYGRSSSDQQYGTRRSAETRRSADHNRYDTDNRVLGDNFEALELRDDEAPARPPRPQANPDLFKPTPVSPPQPGPVDEVDALYRNPSPNNASSAGKAGGKKWQPLTSVAPNPEPEDHDPFSLGDSDDEEAKTKDIKAEDTERLKKAAESKDDSANKAELKPAERSGSVGQKDAAAEALLKESK